MYKSLAPPKSRDLESGYSLTCVALRLCEVMENSFVFFRRVALLRRVAKSLENQGLSRRVVRTENEYRTPPRTFFASLGIPASRASIGRVPIPANVSKYYIASSF